MIKLLHPLRASLRTRLLALSPHRLRLRLRARWLAWRGASVLRAVPAGAEAVATPVASLAARERTGRRHALELVELNLMIERASAGMERPGQPGGMAR